MKYIKEIVKNIARGNKLPGLSQLIKQRKDWTRYNADKDVIKNALPWITFQAIGFLESYLQSGMRVFEFGGGGSTLFFSKKVKELVTVEHNREWYAVLEKEMTNASVQWKGNFVVPQSDLSAQQGDAASPDDYVSADEDSKGFNYKNYVSVIDAYPDNYFDVVLVDGRARPSCLKHSVAKVKPGGILVLDNADREYYLQKTADLLAQFKIVVDQHGPAPYINFFTLTKIWRKAGN